MAVLSFKSVATLKRWLRDKMQEAGSPEAYEEWLHNFFDDDNSISVHGESYDYWDCWELL
jgi:hypothetical protein